MSITDLIKAFLPAQTNTPEAVSIQDIADLIGSDPNYLAQFEHAYASYETTNDRHEASTSRIEDLNLSASILTDLDTQVKIIVNDLVAQTRTYTYQRPAAPSGNCFELTRFLNKAETYDPTLAPVARSHSDMAIIESLPKQIRPQLTGTHAVSDMPIDETTIQVFSHLKRAMEARQAGDMRTFTHAMGMYRVGLEAMDLTPMTYAALATNPESMGYWLPRIADAVDKSGFFQMPSTTIARVPLPLLQMSRMDYAELTETTRRIANDWATKTFLVDALEDKAIFVRHGASSNKFDARNTIVRDAEINDLGEYLIYNHSLDAAMWLQAGCYGKGSSVEWVVREHIEDTEGNPTIYHGLPLHTEFRVFIDCDTDTVLGCANYWDPDTMIEHFASRAERFHDADALHDQVTYMANKDRLCQRYEDNYRQVMDEMEKIIPDMNLSGQWSIDVMMNGKDFWIIDMALAQNSTFNEVVPESQRTRTEVSWMPVLQLES